MLLRAEVGERVSAREDDGAGAVRDREGSGGPLSFELVIWTCPLEFDQGCARQPRGRGFLRGKPRGGLQEVRST